MNIYVPDDLGERVKEATDFNVSSVCQDAIQNELDRRERLAGLGKDMERIEVNATKTHKSPVAFHGKLLAQSGFLYAYLTKKNAIAVHDDREEGLYPYDSFEEFAYPEGTPDQDYVLLVGEVAAQLGEEHVLELDI